MYYKDPAFEASFKKDLNVTLKKKKQIVLPPLHIQQHCIPE